METAALERGTQGTQGSLHWWNIYDDTHTHVHVHAHTCSHAQPALSLHLWPPRAGGGRPPRLQSTIPHCSPAICRQDCCGGPLCLLARPLHKTLTLGLTPPCFPFDNLCCSPSAIKWGPTGQDEGLLGWADIIPQPHWPPDPVSSSFRAPVEPGPWWLLQGSLRPHPQPCRLLSRQMAGHGGCFPLTAGHPGKPKRGKQFSHSETIVSLLET